MKISFIEILLTASAINGSFLSLFIIKSKNSIGKSKIFLVLLLVIYSAGLFLHLISNKFGSDNLIISYLIMMLFTILTPILYLYVCTICKSIVSRKMIVHFIPFSLLILFLIFSWLIENDVLIHKIFGFLIYFIIVFQFFLYIFLILRTLKSYIAHSCNVQNIHGKKMISWLFFLLMSYFLAIIFGGVTDILEIFYEKYNLWDYFWLYISVILYLIAYNSFSLNNVTLSVATNIAAKYSKNSISAKLLSEYEEKLNAVICKKIFLDPKLSLSILSKNTEIPINHLSQIINRKGMNFSEYINRYRIKYSQTIMRQSISITITETAYKSGFNSISAFNSAFKKSSGVSPSTWKKNTFN